MSIEPLRHVIDAADHGDPVQRFVDALIDRFGDRAALVAERQVALCDEGDDPSRAAWLTIAREIAFRATDRG